jgi:hypothetical protein
MTTWIKQGNKSNKAQFPCITIRKKAIGLNADFVALANAEHYSHAEVYVSNDGQKIAIKFLMDSTNHSYLVTADGGTKERQRIGKYKNRLIACGKVIEQNLSLRELSKSKLIKKLVVVQENDLWVANITPSFAYKYSQVKPKESDIGVYRYIKDNEIVYIGRGRIRERIASPERKEWMFDEIEYMLVDEETSIKIEFDLINEHKMTCGYTPVYNKILGFKR